MRLRCDCIFTATHRIYLADAGSEKKKNMRRTHNCIMTTTRLGHYRIRAAKPDAIKTCQKQKKKKNTCDGNILLSLTRGSQNTIVSAAHIFFFSLPASAKYILCVAVKIQSHLRRIKKKKHATVIYY